MPGGARFGAGRKRVHINPVELEKLCSLQCTDQEIAAWFGVSTRTIERRRKVAQFGEAMERGKAKGKLSLRRSLWRLAQGGNPAANIFLAKNLLGYRDVGNSEPSDVGPTPVAPRPDLSSLSEEELEQLEAICGKVRMVPPALPTPGRALLLTRNHSDRRVFEYSRRGDEEPGSGG